ncbi:sulfite exporter TauE/SafE family protein [Pseudomonas sp. F1_0610]|uniref:sulfite exporter TauE/SafE family protein n=1 Tax=Pseudomonas sp. F1_0610 TaxID=3114284 RepID=UPI0039C1D089
MAAVLLTYLVLGAAAGVLAGLFGVGGGLIIVPALVYSFKAQGVAPDILTHLAIGTSLATIIFTSINSALEHNKKGAVLWSLVAWLSVGIILGTALGAKTAALLNGEHLQKIIGVFAIVMAIKMAFDIGPKQPAQGPSPRKPALLSAGGVIGWASAIFGIGGGTLTVPFLTWRGVSMQRAVATSSACGVPIAASGAFMFMLNGWGDPQLPEYSLGFVYLPAMLGIALTSMIFARFGARLAHRLQPKRLKQLFALLLVSVGTSFFI